VGLGWVVKVVEEVIVKVVFAVGELVDVFVVLCVVL